MEIHRCRIRHEHIWTIFKIISSNEKAISAVTVSSKKAKTISHEAELLTDAASSSSHKPTQPTSLTTTDEGLLATAPQQQSEPTNAVKLTPQQFSEQQTELFPTEARLKQKQRLKEMKEAGEKKTQRAQSDHWVR